MKPGRPKLLPGEKMSQESIRLDRRTSADIDAYCAQRNLKRPEAIRLLLREALGGIYRVS